MEWTATQIIWKLCNESIKHSLSSSSRNNECIAFISERALVCKQSSMASLQRVRQHFESADNTYHISYRAMKQFVENLITVWDNYQMQLLSKPLLKKLLMLQEMLYKKLKNEWITFVKWKFAMTYVFLANGLILVISLIFISPTCRYTTLVYKKDGQV